jgi:hypothetical protein
MNDTTDPETLLLPLREPGETPAGAETGLPSDLVGQSAFRLRALALLYAFVFFMSGFFPSLVVADARAQLFSHAVLWLPGAVSIAVALLVAAAAGNEMIGRQTTMVMGLLFEVVGSYGIATAEVLLPDSGVTMAHSMGLSWVSVWTLGFTVVMPTSPAPGSWRRRHPVSSS